MIQKIKDLSEKYFEEVRSIRRHLHANPELSFQEFETAKFISGKLSEWGIEHKTGVADTGIVGEIFGNENGKMIALRADIDALPILEKNQESYCSKNEGIMHACGHDVHSSSLLGAVKILHETKDTWSGSVRFLFQPGEERLPGGASLLIKEGVLENPKPDGIIGQHVFTDLPAGKVGFRSGLYMASADEIYVTVKGQGGHAAIPQSNIDPVLISAHIIVALQQIVSRIANPTIPSVLSFGKVLAMGSTNVIPNEVKIEGTFRTMDEEWRYEAHKRMKKMAESIAEGMGGTCEFDIKVGYPFLMNDPELTEKCKRAAKDYLGEENVVELPLRMSAEDFAFYSQIIPATFYRLGTTEQGGGKSSPVHTDTFDIDEDALKTGMGLMAYNAICQLQ
ncbi:MAG: amidohydrolase [Patiriisocius sp.]|jgi:amidohydrolase